MSDENDSIVFDEDLLQRFYQFESTYDLKYGPDRPMAFSPTANIDIDLPMLEDVAGLVTKQMVKELFGVGDAKATGILLDMMKFNCAFQTGKTYYTTKEHCEYYIKECMGQTRKIL